MRQVKLMVMRPTDKKIPAEAAAWLSRPMSSAHPQ
jgi:hypothetical protein